MPYVARHACIFYRYIVLPKQLFTLLYSYWEEVWQILQIVRDLSN